MGTRGGNGRSGPPSSFVSFHPFSPFFLDEKSASVPSAGTEALLLRCHPAWRLRALSRIPSICPAGSRPPAVVCYSLALSDALTGPFTTPYTCRIPPAAALWRLSALLLFPIIGFCSLLYRIASCGGFVKRFLQLLFPKLAKPAGGRAAVSPSPRPFCPKPRLSVSQNQKNLDFGK